MSNKKENAPGEPRAAEMKPAWEAYQRGDLRGARRQAQALISGSAPDAAKEEARDLIRRTNLDPAVKLTLLVMALTVVGIVLALALR